ncbi:hypothetical protein BXZ70DRAFT_20103 [Cristinia sonorae]|uniref:U2 snRNP-associated SURP motif-containing protein n=1 Tax=Cristinia sonorae TaxID=1940300 RepID=A0A8K0XUP2_9AGAR|nr:hypothetical protein BXZ70DRAFT_20103 [Cristinia sonorae]
MIVLRRLDFNLASLRTEQQVGHALSHTQSLATIHLTMDKTKSKLAAFFDNDDDEHAFPQKPVDDHKLSQYAQGTLRKSKREKEREAAEAKRKEEEANAAKAYAEFVNAFDTDGVASAQKEKNMFVTSGQGNTYAPVTRAGAGPSKGPQTSARMFEDNSAPPSPPQNAPKPKGKRAMDSFLEEIKREQAIRESKYGRHVGQGRSVTSMAAYEGQSGSKDRGDPETSNVFVANLPPHVTEQSLGMFFARCGPVGSVKIMWPRGDGTAGPGADMTQTRRNKSAGLSGFVAFMKRKDAEAALRELDGFDWGGSVLRVGWSKAVPIAPKPMYVVSKAKSEARSASPRRQRSRSPHRQFRSRSRSPHDQRRSSRRHSYSRSRSYSRSPSRSGYRGSRRQYDSRSPRRRRSRSNSIEGEELRDQFIRTVAAEVRGHGSEYEEKLMEREKSNNKYAFLRREHRRHRYYRSLVDRTETLEPEFYDEGYNSIYSTDSAEESERERGRKNELGRLARRRFEVMLRALSGRRGELARCMAFSLEHAEAANEVADIIVSSLLVDGTPVPRKVARLYLICDILHNSAAPLPMAWKFRSEFHARLGLVFDHLSTIYHSFPGRITAETFKKQITSIVDIWEDWIVFPVEFTKELRERLEGNTAEISEEPEGRKEVQEAKDVGTSFTSKFKASSFKPATEPVAETAVASTSNGTDGEPMDEGSDIDGVPVDDVDGEPIGEDVDGVPIDDDLDGEPVNVDGEPMDDSDVDGEPMDDIDGALLEEV